MIQLPGITYAKKRASNYSKRLGSNKIKRIRSYGANTIS